ncbi:hypothetical protein JOL79_29350 [Microbispora sp. RL4-1S]|uniref:Uncharacterized protein n=1 Tax=Microbispora oryzae TaxID=2806554 RepID=A0A941ASC1_9ACTN|nr:hypothetical protein [Microbispora oryzae]MBP2707894.1 hypothetical protein [Microbispora oryzae]
MKNESSGQSHQYNVETGNINIIGDRRPRLRWPAYLSLALVIMAIAAVATSVLLPHDQSPSRSSTADDPLAPIPPPADPPDVSTSLPSGSPPASPKPRYGSALKFKVQRVGTPEGGPDDVVFPESAHKQIERFNTYLGPSNTTPPPADGLSFGGYSLGGIEIALRIENNSGRRLSVNAVRVNKLRRQPIATGAIFYMPSGSGDATNAFMILDYPDPVLRRTTPTTRLDSELPHTEKPFFSTKELSIEPRGESDYLALTFIAQKAAYDFTISFDYSFQGDDQIYTQTLTNGRQPWRASASACRSTPGGDGVLKPGLKYTFVRNAAFRGNDYVTLVGDQAHSCSRWID